MTNYGDLIRVLNENDLAITDVDRVLVSQETYDRWRDELPATKDDLLGRASDYETTKGPAVRTTNGEEKVVYVDEYGEEHSHLL